MNKGVIQHFYCPDSFEWSPLTWQDYVAYQVSLGTNLIQKRNLRDFRACSVAHNRRGWSLGWERAEVCAECAWTRCTNKAESKLQYEETLHMDPVQEMKLSSQASSPADLQPSRVWATEQTLRWLI